MDPERRQRLLEIKKNVQKSKLSAGFQRPQIPDTLVQATIESIKMGMRPDDELSKRVTQQLESQQSQSQRQNLEESKYADFLTTRRQSQNDLLGVRSSLSNRKLVGDQKSSAVGRGDDQQPRNYQNLSERRMAFMIVGEKRSSAQDEQTFYLSEPPLDYSFASLTGVEEIIQESESPQKNRNLKVPIKNAEDRYRTSSLRLSYNFIENFDGLINVILKQLECGLNGLTWLDLAHNNIMYLNEDVLTQIPNLKILYLHANVINDMVEIPKISVLTQLYSLTLHGNPVEAEEGYRPSVLYHIPTLKNLDFFPVTKTDTFNANHFGPQFERKWNKKHRDIIIKNEQEKRYEEMSTTTKVLNENESDSSILDLNGP